MSWCQESYMSSSLPSTLYNDGDSLNWCDNKHRSAFNLSSFMIENTIAPCLWLRSEVLRKSLLRLRVVDLQQTRPLFFGCFCCCCYLHQLKPRGEHFSCRNHWWCSGEDSKTEAMSWCDIGGAIWHNRWEWIALTWIQFLGERLGWKRLEHFTPPQAAGDHKTRHKITQWFYIKGGRLCTCV